MDNTDNRTDLPEGRAEQTRRAADEAQAQAAAGKQAKTGGMTRRTLCLGIGGGAVMLGLGGLKVANPQAIIRPPGGQDEDRLISACIRCEKCYEACPRHVIKPAKIEDGLLGMRSPQLDFSADYCDFCAEENGGAPLCVASCPTEALRLPAGADAHNTIIGLAEIDRKTCLAFRDTGCHFCFDACRDAGYDAIQLDGNGYSPRPYVIGDKCVGCGACESVCVSLQQGSIVAGAAERAIVVRPASSL